MKLNLLIIPVFLFLLSCTQKTESKKENISSAPLDNQIAKTQNIQGQQTLDTSKVPVTTKNIDLFPYLRAPDGYKFANNKTRSLEEKYFFHQDTLIMTVSGKYFKTDIYTSHENFEDTFVVNYFKKVIEDLGGVAIYSGGIPKKANELINLEKPNYAKDMYDPIAYKYKQFLIRTPDKNIWIELCHGLNSEQIDLTVVEEEIKQ